MRHVESRLQSGCVRYFRLAYPRLALNFFSVPNGVCTSPTQGRILHAEGMVAGVADILLLVPSQGYHGLCLEFKQESWRNGRKVRTYQRQEQKEWQAAMEAQGYRYCVVRSFEEFRSIVDGYLLDYKPAQSV